MTNVERRKPEGAPERSPKAGEGAASAFSLMQGCLFVSTKDTSPERSEDGAIIKALRVSIRTLRPSVAQSLQAVQKSRALIRKLHGIPAVS